MSASGSFWDDPTVKASLTRSAFMRFPNVGDKVTGTVSSIDLYTWPDGSPAIEIKFVENDVLTVRASQILLMGHLHDLQPKVGDVLTIELIGIDGSDGKTLKKWRVERVRDGESVVVASP